ncbi:MAG: hypothetical protein Q8922_01625 [Bacteroidota bacterium]|nr:hypothetical protein [Bacteroidota bacterium]MDP4232073.1 hypothetical protein [Bacteroidota bacterium]MDP4241220.1 hypothetical protein [Bacteroidota bacterium]MDP4286612.1 hypothetical protein [Bacteroidota bacterium]
MFTRTFLFLLVASLLAASCRDKVGPVDPPGGPPSSTSDEGMGRLVYNAGDIRVRDGLGPVTLIDSIGSFIRNLQATLPSVNTSGVWSCGDGRFVWIAVDTTWPNGVNDVVVTNNAGTLNSIVYQDSGDALVAFPIISPDGSHVAILMRGGAPAGSRRLLVMTLQSSGDSVVAVDPHFVSTFVAQAAIPCFSPDGTRIAFLDNSGSDQWGNLVVSTIDGSSATTIATHVIGGGDLGLWTVDWSKFNKLAFTDGGLVRVMNSDGSSPILIDTGVIPTWSPDGKTLAYSSSSSSVGGDIMLTSDLGATKINLTNDALNNAFASWSPDGKKIVYTQNFTSTIDVTPSIVSINIATHSKKTLAASGYFPIWLR